MYESGGKLIVYSRGILKNQFLGEGVKYNDKDFYMHANTKDFTREVLNEIIGDEVDCRGEELVEKGQEKPKEREKGENASHPLRPLSKYDLYLEACVVEGEMATSGLDNSF